VTAPRAVPVTEYLSGCVDAKKRLVDSFSKQIPVPLLAIYDGEYPSIDVGNPIHAREMPRCRRSTGEPVPRHRHRRFNIQPEEIASIDAPAVRQMRGNHRSASSRSDGFAFEDNAIEGTTRDAQAARILKLDVHRQR